MLSQIVYLNGDYMDRRLADSAQEGDSRFTGVSSEIQNDLIRCLDSIFEDTIVTEIDECTFISVQVDPFLCLHQEQVSMTARMDRGSEIVERQMGSLDVSKSRDSAAMSQLVTNKLSTHSNIKNKLVIQTYDGAAVMSGHVGSIQTRVR